MSVIKHHDISHAPNLETVRQNLKGPRRKMVAIGVTVFLMLWLVLGKHVVLSILMGIVSFIICGVGFSLLLNKGYFKEVIHYYRMLELRHDWIKKFITELGFQPTLNAESGFFYVDESHQAIFYTEVKDDELHQVDYRHIRGWSKSTTVRTTTHTNKQGAYAYTTEKVKAVWLCLQLIDTQTPTVEIKFTDESEVDNWIERMDVLINHA